MKKSKQEISKNHKKPAAQAVLTTKRPGKQRPKPRTTDSCETRNQELRMEENKRAQRKKLDWKRKQQKKLGKNVKVVDVTKLLGKTT